MGLLPGGRLVAGFRLDARGDLARLQDVARLHPQFIHQPRLTGQDLRRLDQHIGHAIVDLRDAGM